MRRVLRQASRLRYDFRCGYWCVNETNMGAEMTVDHFQPHVHGGDDSHDNLVYCCHACNEFKGDYWQVEPDLRLLHPLLDDLSLHYREQEDGTLLSSDGGAGEQRNGFCPRPDRYPAKGAGVDAGSGHSGGIQYFLLRNYRRSQTKSRLTSALAR